MIKKTWHRSIDEISEEEWSTIFGKTEPVKSYAFNMAVEKAGLDGVTHWWLCVRENKTVKAIIPCFTYRAKVDVFCGKPFQTFADNVRNYFHSFLTINIFFCGSPIATCDELWGIPEGISNRDRIIKTVINSLRQKTLQEKCRLTIIKEIPGRNKNRFGADIKNSGFLIAESLPNSFVPVNKEVIPFPSALRTRYKRRIKSSYKSFDKNGYRWEIVNNFSKYAGVMERLYLQVLEKSDSRFETLNAAFFRSVNEHLKTNAFVIMGFSKTGQPVCFELVLENSDSLIPLYVGIDYDHLSQGNLYFNCINRIVREAELRDKRCVIFGQTSYLAKAYTGAVFERLYLYVYGHGLFWKIILKYFLPVLFPISVLPEVRCYRKEKIHFILKCIKEKGISNEPIKTPDCFNGL